MSRNITEVISGAWVYVQLEWLQYLKYWLQNRAQWASLLGELSRHTHAWQRHSLLSSLHSVVATLLQVVSHAHNVSKLPLIHSTKGCTEAPNLGNKLHLGSQCFKIPELRVGNHMLVPQNFTYSGNVILKINMTKIHYTELSIVCSRLIQTLRQLWTLGRNKGNIFCVHKIDTIGS